MDNSRISSERPHRPRRLGRPRAGRGDRAVHPVPRDTATTSGSTSRPGPTPTPTYMAAIDLIVQCVTMWTIERDAARRPARRGRGRHRPHRLARRDRRLVPRLVRLPAAGRRPVRHPPGQGPGDPCAGTRANNFLPYTVEHPARPRRHPITAGSTTSSSPPSSTGCCTTTYIDVLATTTHPVRPWHPWHRPITSPAIWTRQWGAGRDRRHHARAQPRRAREPERAHRSSKGECCGRAARIGIVGLRCHLARSTSRRSTGCRPCGSPRSPTSTAPGRARSRPSCPDAARAQRRRTARRSARSTSSST